MKRLAIAVALMASVVCHADPAALLVPSPIGTVLGVGTWLATNSFEDKQIQVKVIGVGRTEKEAREEGFRVAIEYAVGQIVLSETEVSSGKVKRKDHTNYSSGYVRAYAIEKQEMRDGFVNLYMTVIVSPSRVANRLQADAISKLPVQYATLNDSSAKGDKVLLSVLADYPKKAYQIEIKNIAVERQADRSAVLVVPYKMQWSKDYIYALGEAINATREDVDYYDRYTSHLIEVKYRPAYSILDKTWQTWTVDERRIGMFQQTLSDVKLRITIKDKNGIVAVDKCVDNEGEFTQIYGNMIIVDGNYRETRRAVRVPLNGNIDDYDNLQLAVVRSNECSKQYVAYNQRAKIQ